MRYSSSPTHVVTSFTEDLFRGSLPQHNPPSSSFQPLSTHVSSLRHHLSPLIARSPLVPAQPRPNPPREPHPFPRQSPVLPGRSHPLPARAHTPPPAASSPPAIPCTSGCCNQPSSSSQISPPHPHPSLHQHNQPRGWPPPATAAGPSHPPLSTGSLPRSSSSSHLRSPADEVVSAVTSAWSWPYGANPHQVAYHNPHHPQGGLAAPVDSRNRGGAFHDPHSVRHTLAYHAQISSGVRGKTRYGDTSPDVTSSAAIQSQTGRGVKAGAAVGTNASTTNAEDSERRHCCPHCNKRFNRPSSLAIHVNTHTGAKRTCRSLLPSSSSPLLPFRRSTHSGY